MLHFQSYEEITEKLNLLSSGKEMDYLPNGKRIRINAYGDLFEYDIPKLMYGNSLVKSSSGEDIDDHIDYYMYNESYDFKAPKRRGGVIVQGKFLVERKNVIGKTGWLYGKEKYLMIGYVDTNNKFWFLKYDRQKLADWVDANNVEWLESRKDRMDKVAWITPPGTEGGLLEKIRIGKYLDEALYNLRTNKFNLIQQLNRERNENKPR